VQAPEELELELEELEELELEELDLPDDEELEELEVEDEDDEEELDLPEDEELELEGPDEDDELEGPDEDDELEGPDEELEEPVVVVLLLDEAVGEPELEDELAVGVPPAPPRPEPPRPEPPSPEPPWPLPVEVPRAPPGPVEPSLFAPPPLQCVSPRAMVSKERDCKAAKRMEVSLSDPHCLSHGIRSERFAFVVGASLIRGLVNDDHDAQQRDAVVECAGAGTGAAIGSTFPSHPSRCPKFSGVLFFRQ
jgi:hypothetical protein